MFAQRAGKPAILIPNPFYAAYSAGAAAADCEPVYCRPREKPASCPTSTRSTTRCSGAPSPLHRLAVEPQGAVADEAYLSRLDSNGAPLRLPDFCRRMLLRDLSQRRAPHGMLQVSGPDFTNVVVVPLAVQALQPAGLRVGFAAGDRRFLGRYIELRNIAAPQVPVPAQEVAIAAYGDEAHVEKNRELYVAKFDLADQIIGGRYGYQRRPAASSSGSM